MSLFQQLLAQVKSKLDEKARANDDIAQVISEITKITISAQQLTLKKGTLYISAVPTIKMAITIKKEALLASFKEKNIPVFSIA